MQAWIELGNAAFELVLRASLAVALLVAAVLVLERLAGRWLTPRWRYGLWLLVAARLVLPVPLAVAHGGLEGLLAAASGSPSAVDPERLEPELGAGTALSSTPFASVGPSRPGPRPRPPRGHAAAPGDPEARVSPQPVAAPTGSPVRRGPVLTPVVAGASPTPRPSTPLPWRALVFSAALGVALLLLGVDGARAVVFELRVRRARQLDDPQARQVLEDCCGRMGVAALPRVLEVPGLTSPAVSGLRRPTLLLPPGLTRRLDEQELRHVLLHELAHWRRHDVPFGFVLCALHSLYWFHPLVWVGLRRLRASQEVARDWEALDADRSPAPCSYARTLLKLCEGVHVPPAGPLPDFLPDFLHRGRELTKRIHMIQAYRPARRSTLLGTTLLVTLGWVSFTSAAPPEGEKQTDAGAQLSHIKVERVQDTAPWRIELESVLEREVHIELNGANPTDIVEYLRQLTGANFVLEPDFANNAYGVDLDARLAGIPLREALDALCAMMTEDLGWALINGAIYLGTDVYEREENELRFYRIGALIEDADDELYAAEELASLLVDLVGRPGDSWDREGASIEVWGRLLVISQSVDVHDQAQALLDRFLNRGAQPEREMPAWRVRIDEALAATTELRVENRSMGEVCQELSLRHGVPIVCPHNYEDEELSLALSNVSLQTTLEWLCASWDLRPAIIGGAIVLEEYALGDLELEFHDIGDLLEASEDEEYFREYVSELIRNQVDPESWDTDPSCSLTYWNGMMLVNHTPAVQARVARLLGALRRTVGD